VVNEKIQLHGSIMAFIHIFFTLKCKYRTLTWIIFLTVSSSSTVCGSAADSTVGAEAAVTRVRL